MKKGYSLLLLLLTLLLPSLRSSAQLLQSDPFTASKSSNWRLGGSTRFTAGSLDSEGMGYLRLTDATNGQTGFALSRIAFASSQGFNISFEFFSYGGTPAYGLYGDGFSVFLIDGKTDPDAFKPGANGGGLAYSQHVPDPERPIDGATNGYVGIGFDEYGYYASSDGHTDGLGRGVFPQRVSVRGSGNGLDGYNLLKASSRLPFDLNVTTTRAQATSSDYRRAIINVVPLANSYRVSVRVQNAQNVTTALSEYTLPTPPATLRLGFGGSTGGATSTHEIRNLVVVVPPVAVDDAIKTANNVPVKVNVVANDQAPGSKIDRTSVDLDPTTTVIDQQRTTADGVFRVDTAGVVSFTPAGTQVVGTVALSYLVYSRAVTDNTGTVITPRTATNQALLMIDVAPKTPLPVELVSFTVTQFDERVQIRWKTATELNTAYFAVERRTATTPFVLLGEIPSAGNAGTEQHYELLTSALPELSYYRLRQVDQDNSQMYSNVVVLDAANLPAQSTLQCFPNPVGAGQPFTVTLPAPARCVDLLDPLGRVLLSQRAEVPSLRFSLPAALPAGLYVVRATGMQTPGSWQSRLVIRP